MLKKSYHAGSLLLVFAVFIPPAFAESGSMRVLSADPGIFWTQSAVSKPPQALTKDALIPPNTRICFSSANEKLAMRATRSNAEFNYQARQAGCVLLEHITQAATMASPHTGSTLSLKTIWRALTGSSTFTVKAAATRGGVSDAEVPTGSANSAMQAANGLGAATADRWHNRFCVAHASIRMQVGGSLQGIVVPAEPGVSATLVSAYGAAPVQLQAIGGLLRLPDMGKPGDTLALHIQGKAPDAPACTLELELVPHNEVPTGQITDLGGEHLTDANAVDAAKALALVVQHGDHWGLEALRQLYPYYNQRHAIGSKVFQSLAAPAELGCRNTTVNIPTRFDVAMLQAEVSYLQAGATSLYLAWAGGVGPYGITIEGNGAHHSFSIPKGICQATLQLPHPLAVGRYRLAISQSDSQQGKIVQFVEDNLMVVEPGKRPLPPKSLEGKPVAQADWLAAQQQGTWRFQAAQDIAAQRFANPAAQQWLARLKQEPAAANTLTSHTQP